MKKWILIVIGIILIGIKGIGIKINSDFDQVAEVFHSEHSLKGADFVLISESISPNNKYIYYEYQFDNGGFGYSRVFWSVIENVENKNNLKKGLIPDGFKTTGWTNKNELILEKWKPYYNIKNTELKSGTELNGVKINIADSIPQGKMTYELYFAEFGGRMKNLSVEILITGNKITVYNNEKNPLTGGKIIIDGVLLKHKTGKWIIGETETDRNAEEIGGCSGGPTPIDFKTKIIEWC
tara:strand:- start:87 stop:800 length:714 start_codon:yes stop_codon:yes gene_type:complete